MKRLFLSISLLFCCIYASGYYPVVKNYTKNEYKGSSKTWHITQSSCGNIWAANNSGILEFDGREWSIIEAKNKTGMRSLLFDEDSDRLYFGAVNETGYLDFHDRRHINYVSLLDTLSNSINDIWAIHKIKDTLYFRENNRVFSLCNGQVREYGFPNKVSVSEVIDGSLYIFVNSIGVLRQGADGEFERVPGTEGLGRLNICAIKKISDDTIEIVSATSGLYHLTNGVLTKKTSPLGDSLEKAIAYCCAVSENYRAYGTVNNGVYILDTLDDSVIHLNTTSGLQNNTVLSLFFDKQKNLWLGLDKGIDLIELNSAEYRLFAANDLIGAGYTSEVFDDKLWLGTNQGLYYCPFHGSAKEVKDSAIKAFPELKGQMWQLLAYDGVMFACADRGLGIISADGKFDFIRMNGVWKVIPLETQPGRMLGCSYDRLFLLKKSAGRWKFDKWIEGFNESSKVFEEDKDGSIWFSHWIKGLYNLQIDYGTGEVLKEKFLSREHNFPQDWSNTPIKLDGNIIFQTADGFYSFDKSLNKAVPIDSLNTLFSSRPIGMGIYKLKNSDYFFSSSSIQALYYKSSENYVMDSLSLSSLVSRRITGFEDLREFDEGVLMLNTEDGFSIIMEDLIKDKSNLSYNNLYIKEIAVAKPTGDSVIFESRNLEAQKTKVVVPFKDNSLKFKVALPTFDSEDKVRFSYKLKGYDSGWSPFQEDEHKEYTRISPGEFTFQVRASVPNSTEMITAEIPVKILKPWYLKGWIIICYITAFLFALIALCFYLKKRIEASVNKRQKEKENIEKENRMRNELKMKADELASSTMNLIRKNEILQKIDAELQKASDNLVEDRNKSLRIISKIRSDIKENISHDNSWNRFEKNFDLVYVDFLKKLEDAHPGLSTTDKKLCAYLKMGLSSKEIAPLLNITVRSVEMNRYRVRKKLGLGREDNLMDYLGRF